MSKSDIIEFKPAPLVRPRLNTGGLLDIPAGRYHTCKYDDHCLSGSHSSFIGAGGKGNTFKTTLILSLMIIIMSRYKGTSLFVFDTEITFDWNRIFDIMMAYPSVDPHELMELGLLLVTSAGEHTGNEWWRIVRGRSAHREKTARGKAMVETPFLNADGTPICVLPLEQHLCDSMSQLTTDAQEDLYNSTEIDDKNYNTDALRGGNMKTRLVQQIPQVAARGHMSIACTAHVGKEYKLDRYDMGSQQLAALGNDLKFKNVPEKFTFLTSNTWYVKKASPFIHDRTKAAWYPLDGMNEMTGDVDLQKLLVVNARSKSGPTGHAFELLVSQDYGFLPSLSEFHYLNTRKDNFGLTAPEGQQRSRRLQIYDEPLLARTKVRGLIDNDYKLKRALEITSELAQMESYWMDMDRSLIMEPGELKAKLVEQGYDMDRLLTTRGHWTYDHYNLKNGLPPLSTLDLLHMAKGMYKPWWLENGELKKAA